MHLPFSYGRGTFTTDKGLLGLATRGVRPGDAVAILLGGDVPVILRPFRSDSEHPTYNLLCECFVQSDGVMRGDLIRTDLWLAEDITLV